MVINTYPFSLFFYVINGPARRDFCVRVWAISGIACRTPSFCELRYPHFQDGFRWICWYQVSDQILTLMSRRTGFGIFKMELQFPVGFFFFLVVNAKASRLICSNTNVIKYSKLIRLYIDCRFVSISSIFQRWNRSCFVFFLKTYDSFKFEEFFNQEL